MMLSNRVEETFVGGGRIMKSVLCATKDPIFIPDIFPPFLLRLPPLPISVKPRERPIPTMRR